MKEYTIDELIAALMTKCGFGAVIYSISVSPRGYLHRYILYNVSVGTHTEEIAMRTIQSIRAKTREKDTYSQVMDIRAFVFLLGCDLCGLRVS